MFLSPEDFKFQINALRYDRGWERVTALIVKWAKKVGRDSKKGKKNKPRTKSRWDKQKINTRVDVNMPHRKVH